MAQVIIRNLHAEVVQRLRDRARSHGHSLEQELREILRAAAGADRGELLALADEIRTMTPRKLRRDSADLVREDRNR